MNEVDVDLLTGFLMMSNGSDPEAVTKAAAMLICIVTSTMSQGNTARAREGVLAVGKDMAALVAMAGFGEVVASYTGDKATH